MKPRKPTKQEIISAYGKSVPDIIAPRLKILFVGINPGLYTAAIGHHFGRPGNRFWPSLYTGGFTPRLYSPYEDHELLNLDYGITNLVNRATNKAQELSSVELKAGSKILTQKVIEYKPEWVAIVGLQSYRIAFDKPKAVVGLQAETIGKSKVWVLPNPSGLNAHFTPEKLTHVFREFRKAL